MIRVLIVDDSAVLRQQIKLILQSDVGLVVVGEARNGEEGIVLAKSLHPDVITMDVRMPKMDGLEAIKRIMAESPAPIIVVTSDEAAKDVGRSAQAVKLGALAVLPRPGSIADPAYKALSAQLINQVKLMSSVRVVSRTRTKSVALPDKPEPAVAAPGRSIELIAIGASTGGPAALYRVLGGLPGDLQIPVVIVQHIALGFVEGLAGWLAGGCKLSVKVGKHGDKLQPGTVSVAPDGCHMIVDAYGRIRLREGEPVNGHRPSVTVLFKSVAESHGSGAMGVLLTGMGSDGATGLRAMKDAGAITLAEDEASCVVFGMPKEAIALGAAKYVIPLDKMAATMIELSNVGRRIAVQQSPFGGG